MPCKRRQQKRRLEKENTQLESESVALKNAWNGERLRQGDMVGPHLESPEKGSKLHANMWLPSSVLRTAWLQPGKAPKTLRNGLDALTRENAVLTTVSGAACIEQDEWVSQMIDKIVANGESPVFIKYYDATPRLVSFGRMQAALFPHARYSWFDGQEWHSLKYENYIKQVPRQAQAILQRGTLDILASSLECTWVSKNKLHDSFRVCCPPQVMQNATASCIFSATEDSVPQCSSPAIQVLSRKVPWIIVGEQPDACASNLRKQCETSESFRELPNVLHAKGKCAAHQCKRIVETAERGSVGDVHATVVACSQQSHAVAIQASFRKLLEETVLVPGDPLPELVQRNKEILRHTLARRAELIAGDPSVDESYVDRLDNSSDPLARFLFWFNGDYSSPIVQHYVGDRIGMGREAILENMFAAALTVDILVCNEKEPSMDDWQTCGNACAKVSIGILCHNVLERSF